MAVTFRRNRRDTRHTHRLFWIIQQLINRLSQRVSPSSRARAALSESRAQQKKRRGGRSTRIARSSFRFRLFDLLFFSGRQLSAGEGREDGVGNRWLACIPWTLRRTNVLGGMKGVERKGTSRNRERTNE